VSQQQKQKRGRKDKKKGPNRGGEKGGNFYKPAIFWVYGKKGKSSRREKQKTLEANNATRKTWGTGCHRFRRKVQGTGIKRNTEKKKEKRQEGEGIKLGKRGLRLSFF